MHYKGLDHVGFTVSDLDRSIPFYTFLLGEQPVGRLMWEPDRDEFTGRIVGYPGLRLEGAFWQLPGGLVLELLQYHHPETGFVDMETYNVGSGHLGLETEDIWAEFERLRDHVQFRNNEPVQIPSGPAKGGWAVYMRDPDGITIELVQGPA
jgi:catechol 2,3-dioxygenase-like lactoylglutathione lyase family enzyme